MGGEHTVRCAGDVLSHGTIETYMILLTVVTPINLIKRVTKRTTKLPEISKNINKAPFSPNVRDGCCFVSHRAFLLVGSLSLTLFPRQRQTSLPRPQFKTVERMISETIKRFPGDLVGL